MIKKGNNAGKYANVITTIAVAIVLIFWHHISGRLDALDQRLRTVEQQTAAIIAKIESGCGIIVPQSRPAEAPGSPRTLLLTPSAYPDHIKP